MKLICVTVFLCWCWISTRNCKADVKWDAFEASLQYANLRMVTDLEDYFTLRYFPKEISLVWARMECSRSCANNRTCQGFNFYEVETFYICEMMPANLCTNNILKAYVNWPGSLVWEKLGDGMKKSCFETKLSSSGTMECETLRPGCLGVWPNCYNCIKTCRECTVRYSSAVLRSCILWPEGDAEYMLPIFGLCRASTTFFVRRQVNLATGKLTVNYRLSFHNMNRLYRLEPSLFLQIHFTNNRLTRYYKFHSSIESNGTLVNIELISSDSRDMLNLIGERLQPTSFVNVTDDRYSCGSFWLLDPNNATYCPGGNVSMFGNIKMSSSQGVVDTGIHCDNIDLLTYTSLALNP